MTFTNSKLVNYVKLSPNCNKPRKYAIKKIVIHHMAGNLSVETCGNVFANPERMASSNYGIGSDGRVGLYVEECNRSWCSSNGEVDHQAITIEVANDEIGGNWHVSDKALNKLVELCVDICKRNGIERLNFTGDKNGNLLMHKYFAATACPGPYLGSKFPWIAEQVNKQLAVKPVVKPTSGLQATSLKSMTNEAIIAQVGPLFTADQKKTGVLASVSMAQFLLESAYGKSELAQEANNCFGMKKNLSGNTWANSAWDGTSVYAKETKEQHADGTYTTITAEFRKYACIEDSVADHSAYLVGAKKGAELRYAGLKGETDYKVAAQIIKDGGYATSLTYVDKLCNLIEQLGLTRYNATTTIGTTTKALYRVRKSWDNVASQLGAFSSLENAKAACKVGYFVFDENGKVVYPVVETKAEFAVGSEIKLVAGAKYINGKNIPSWVLKSKLYVREVRENGHIVFSTLKTGAITGVVAPKYVVTYTGADAFKPYTVVVTADALNVRKGPGILYGKVKVVYKGNELVIAQVKNNWGMIAGTNTWVSLKYTKKK